VIGDFHSALDGLISALSSQPQIEFGPPNSSAPTDTVYFSLVEIRENRRSRPSAREYDGERNTWTPALLQLDCHYLVSAFCAKQSNDEPQLSSSTREAELLFALASLLADKEPLQSGQFPDLTKLEKDLGGDFEIPMVLAPPEGFPKLPDFWASISGGMPWRPVLYLIATLPALRVPVAAGPPVLSRHTTYSAVGDGESEEVWQIAGVIRDRHGATLSSARVMFDNDQTHAEATSNDNGQYTVWDIPAGAYTVRLTFHGAVEQASVTVPSATTKYDFAFTTVPT
jgi:hypothetical protein